MNKALAHTDFMEATAYIQFRLRISEALAALSKETGKRKTMAWLASRLGVDHQTVLYWNQGRSVPRLPKFLLMMAVLKCNLEDLVDQTISIWEPV